MGGTTAKASMVEDGQVMRAHEYAVGAGIMVGSRLLTGAGYTLKVPAIDLAEVGAGGGSHVWIDAGGALQVGPQSAGAAPGPVCYDAGGEVPTVTDASVILGLLNPRHLVGGALELNAEKARAAFAAGIAEPLGMSLEAAAYGAHEIAASNMIRAIKAVSTERGRDPREFALFAFGGNGPLFACGMAAALGIGRVIVPPAPGLFSSFGLLYADVEHHYSRTFRRLLRQADLGEIERAWGELARQAASQLAEEGFAGTRARLLRSAALHYKGQSFDLVVPVADGPIDAAHGRAPGGGLRPRAREDLRPPRRCRRAGRAGVDPGRRPGRARRAPACPTASQSSRAEPEPGPPRRVYFGSEHGWIETPILRRSDLAKRRAGPLIIEEYDATCVVPPGATAELDKAGSIVIALDA